MSEEHVQENYPQENNELLNNEKENQNEKEDTSKKLFSGHEIISEEENKKYLLNFINKNDLIKIILKEKDIFPYKTYELITSLEELQPKNVFFSNFVSNNELIQELNNPNTAINFSLFKKKANIIELFFVFPIEDEDNTMEIELNANEINDREIFRQLFEKYQSIKEEQEEDAMQLKNRMNAIEQILGNMQKEQEIQKEKDRLEKEKIEKERLEKEMENEEHGEEEHKEEENEEMKEKEDIENTENVGKKLILGNKNKNNELNEIKSSKQNSKSTFQKDKDKNIKKGKPEKKKQEKNINNNKKKFK